MRVVGTEWESPRSRELRERRQRQAAFEALMELADAGSIERDGALAALGLDLVLEEVRPADVWQNARLRRLGADPAAWVLPHLR